MVMDTLSTIYVVISCADRYDDYREEVVKAFVSFDAASQYVADNEKTYKHVPGRINPNDWDTVDPLINSWLDTEYINFCNAHNIELNEYNEVLDWNNEKNEELIEAHINESSAKPPEKYLQYLNVICPEEHYTLADVVQYMEYFKYKYVDDYTYKIKEIELIN